VLGAEMLNVKPSGTMPHALIIAFQDHVRAWEAYDRHVPKDVPRIALADTYLDEVKESIMAAEHVENLAGVRLDTPSSRKGNFVRIVQEVRWELDVRGYNDVKIFVSGGLDAESVRILSEAGADGFGVGGAISNAPAIDFAMDIVAINQDGKWIPAAKRGKFSGKKIVWHCEKCLEQEVTMDDLEKVLCPSCNKAMQKSTVKLLDQGKILQAPTSPKETREYVLDQIRRLTP
jgi:nicotinate phosphoribosyltransferase